MIFLAQDRSGARYSHKTISMVFMIILAIPIMLPALSHFSDSLMDFFGRSLLGRVIFIIVFFLLCLGLLFLPLIFAYYFRFSNVNLTLEGNLLKVLRGDHLCYPIDLLFLLDDSKIVVVKESPYFQVDLILKMKKDWSSIADDSSKISEYVFRMNLQDAQQLSEKINLIRSELTHPA